MAIASATSCKKLEIFCPAGTELWLKKLKNNKVKVILKGHRFVESAQHLLLLNKYKKFDNDAIARFCWIVLQSMRINNNNSDNDK